MKTSRVIFGILIGLLISISALAQSSDTQLWYAMKFKIKPERLNEFVEYNKTYTSTCQENNYSFPIYVWRSQMYNYYWFTPIKDYNTVNEIMAEAWEFIPNMEKGFVRDFYENIEYQEEFFIRSIDSLSYKPKQNVEGLDYIEWWVNYMKPWTGGKYRRAFKACCNMQELNDFDYPMLALHSDIGMPGGSSYIMVFRGKNPADLYNHFEKAVANLDLEAKTLFKELDAVMRKFEKIPFWYQKELSYIPNEVINVDVIF